MTLEDTPTQLLRTLFQYTTSLTPSPRHRSSAQDEVITGGSKAGDVLRAASNTHNSKGDGKEDDGNNNNNHTRNIGSKGKKQVAT